jgi:two-component sensor histidine kinase
VTLGADTAGPAVLGALLADAGLAAAVGAEEAEEAGQALAGAARRGAQAAEADVGAAFAGRSDGILWLQARIDPAPDAHRWRGLFRDVTLRRQAERQDRLVRQEMAHRVKNLFAVVAALLTITARDMPEAQAYAQDMRQRITALASAYRYLEEDPGREDEARTLRLGGLVREVLAPYQDVVRIVLRPTAERLAIGPRSATGVALMLHELATNAAKHGALAEEGGLVTLRGRVASGTLHLFWREADGPGLDGPPSSEGFGTRLLDRIAARLLGAPVRRRWLPGGLVVVLPIAVAVLES